MADSLKALTAIISSAVITLDSIYAKHSCPFPSLDEPYRPDPVNDVAVLEATQLVIAAASQLIATVRNPALTILESATAAQLTGNLGVVNELDIPEILRAAGPAGMHISEIGKQAGRILRHLATRHIFREVSPDFFANNRISSVLDSGKSLEEIRSSLEKKYDTGTGLQAFTSEMADQGLKVECEMVPYMVDSVRATSQEPTVGPINRAYGMDLSLFEWYDQPGNEWRRKRFGEEMHCANFFVPANALTTGFEWSALKEGSLVVDVGGGIGIATLELAAAYPHIRYVVQDREALMPNAEAYWKEHAPEALAQGRVTLQAHDFFKPQPIRNATVFFMRVLIHDWSDTYAKKIYAHLRAAATPDTVIVHLEAVIPYAAPLGKDKKLAEIQGALQPELPAPLLPNGGITSFPMYMADMLMLRMCNAQERTVGQWLDVVDGTGWKLDRIHRIAGGNFCHLVLVPV